MESKRAKAVAAAALTVLSLAGCSRKSATGAGTPIVSVSNVSLTKAQQQHIRLFVVGAGEISQDHHGHRHG